MANPLHLAVAIAGRTDGELAKVFAGLGNSQHPRGQGLAAYRTARRGLRDVVQHGGRVGDAQEVLGQWRMALRTCVEAGLRQAQTVGQENANRQLEVYGLEGAPAIDLVSERYQALEAVLARADAQAANVRSLLAMGADAALILGDEERTGALRPGEVLGAAAFWSSALLWEAFQAVTLARGRSRPFEKQVVAGLDARTTDCCLRAHGQVRPLDERFHLVGTPRYADWLDWPPFHYWCRSSVALYLAKYDDGLGERMRQAARQMLDERARGVWRDPDPADAFG